MTQFERKPIRSNPADFGLEHEDISFSSKDGLTIKGWWIEASNNDRVIVIVHGSEGNRAEPPGKMLDIAKEFVNYNYNVLMFDMRGHGESEAKHVSAGLHERYDLLGAVDYVKQRGINKTGVVGFSLGAAASLMTLSETEEIDAVVSDSGYADLTDIIKSEFGKRSNLPRFFIPLVLFLAKVMYDVDFAAVKPIEAVHKTDIPIFIVHGEQDDMVPVEHAYRLAKACRNPDSQLWVLPDAGHSNPYLVRPKEYIEKVISFFDVAFE
jgi:dipeptidyl aminopeptidase/acylaminoacyl peptidase